MVNRKKSGSLVSKNSVVDFGLSARARFATTAPTTVPAMVNNLRRDMIDSFMEMSSRSHCTPKVEPTVGPIAGDAGVQGRSPSGGGQGVKNEHSMEIGSFQADPGGAFRWRGVRSF
jgi:hypothetical protein